MVGQLPPGVSQDDIETITKKFDDTVDYLRNPRTFANLQVNKLTTLMWRLIGNKIAYAAITEVPTLSIGYYENKAGDRMMSVLLPFCWHKMLEQEKWVQRGAVVFVASQIVDGWHGKISSDYNSKQATIDRSQANEAGFLLTVKEKAPEYRFTDYQKKVLETYPLGLASYSDTYELKEFIPGDFQRLEANY